MVGIRNARNNSLAIDIVQYNRSPSYRTLFQTRLRTNPLSLHPPRLQSYPTRNPSLSPLPPREEGSRAEQHRERRLAHHPSLLLQCRLQIQSLRPIRSRSNNRRTLSKNPRRPPLSLAECVIHCRPVNTLTDVHLDIGTTSCTPEGRRQRRLDGRRLGSRVRRTRCVTGAHQAL